MRLNEVAAGWLLAGTLLFAGWGYAQLGIREIDAREDARLTRIAADIRDYLGLARFEVKGGGDSIAFPGARGYAASALVRCRANGIRVVKVTNTNTSGVGSLAAAMDSASIDNKLTIIIPTTGGTIGAVDYDYPNSKCYFIAGHAAPGGGLAANGRLRLSDNTTNVLVWGVRLQKAGQQNWLLNNGDTIYLREVSSRLGIDDSPRLSGDTSASAVSMEGLVHRVTLDRVLHYWHDRTFGMCMPISGDPDTKPATEWVTVVENFMTSTKRRCPLMATNHVDMVNSVVYNTRDGFLYGSNEFNFQVRQSWFRHGPYNYLTGEHNYPVAFTTLCEYSCPENCGDQVCTKQAHMANIASRTNGYDPSTPIDSLWSGSKRSQSDWDTDTAWTPAGVKRDSFTAGEVPQFPVQYFQITRALADSIVHRAGAYRQLQCDGTWALNRDALDSARVKEWDDSTGVDHLVNPDTISAPTLAAGTACTDADGDGIPAAFESQYSNILSDSNPNDYDDDPDQDGWSNVEEYLFASNPRVHTSSSGFEAGTGGGGDSVAFPGAKGWGAEALTTCSRAAGKVFVHAITPAQLDSVLENAIHGADTLDIIVFTAGGRATNLVVEKKFSCVYIAAQTAPGDGAAFRRINRTLRLMTDTRDMVVRGATFQQSAADAVSSIPHISIENAQRVVFAENDHYWCREKHINPISTGATDTVADLTIQRSLFAQCQGEPTSIQISSGDNGGTMTRVSLGYNLFHTNSHRNPYVMGGDNSSTDVFDRQAQVNAQVIYNGRQGLIMVGGSAVDVMDTYCKSGPWSEDGVPTGNDYSWCVVLQDGNDQTQADSLSEVYVDRLIGVHNRDTLAIADSLWADGGDHQEVACYYRDCVNPGGGGDPRDSLGAQAKRDTALTGPTFTFSRINPFALKDTLLGTATDSGHVGAYRRIQCDGTWAYRSDSLHSALLKEARDSTGLAVQPDSAYVAARQDYTKAAGTACTDSDSDGMPNAFENRIQGGTDSTGATIYGDPDGDGWSNAEEYVNGSDPLSATSIDGDELPAGATWGSRYVRRVRAVDTIRITGTDTDTVLWAVPESIPDGISYLAARDTKLALARVLVLTCDDASGGGAILDSTAADDTASAMGRDPDSLRTIDVPGC